MSQAGFDGVSQAGLEAMEARNELGPEVDPTRLATQTLMLLQGGLLLSQVRRDVGQMRIAVDTVLELIEDARKVPAVASPRR